jgi:hypothetical protein
MKKLVPLSLAVVLVSCLLFVTGASAKVAETQTFKGMVESVSLASDVKSGNISEITAVDSKGQKMIFAVRSGIGIEVSGRDRLATLKSLDIGDKVIIEYTMTKEGVNKVTAIECNKPRDKKSY